MTKRTKSTVILTLTILLTLTAIGWATWSVFEAFVSVIWTRVIALVALVLLPAVGWSCYQVGLIEAKGRLKGVDQGIGKVAGAATRVIGLQAQARQAARPDPQVVMLPSIEPTFSVRQLQDGEVEL